MINIPDARDWQAKLDTDVHTRAELIISKAVSCIKTAYCAPVYCHMPVPDNAVIDIIKQRFAEAHWRVEWKWGSFYTNYDEALLLYPIKESLGE